ncbi:unnamed protein product [Durusdinium trenchii]|uniref:Uncharacterized protein n=2 Tax=Durusdinium trenchii TaxID=1381693 RepID=A0ABP0P568_9DINO
MDPKCRRLDLSQLRSVEGEAEWKMLDAGRMRAHYLRRGAAARGQCECQHFHLPGFPEVDFTFMLYPMGLCLHMESSDEHSSGSRSAAVARSVVLGLHVSGPGCEGVGFEVRLHLRLLSRAAALAEAVEEKALAGTGRVSCESLWPEGVDVCQCSCHVLAAPPPCGDPVLRLSTVWQPQKEADSDEDIERLDGDDDE